MVKNLPANAGDVGSTSGSGRSPGEGNCNLLQYFCLGNPMSRGAWQATDSFWGHKRGRHDLVTKQQYIYRLLTFFSFELYAKDLPILPNDFREQGDEEGKQPCQFKLSRFFSHFDSFSICPREPRCLNVFGVPDFSSSLFKVNFVSKFLFSAQCTPRIHVHFSCVVCLIS